MKWSPSDYTFMSRALQLAKRGRYTTFPNPNVGCVIVKAGEIIGEGWHEKAGGPHAEINALAAAGKQSRDATCYITLEPCAHEGKTPPCTDALIESGVSRVISAMVDPNTAVSGEGHRKLAEKGIITDSGLLEAQARSLNPGFIRRMESGRPYIRCKLAMSLDGRTGMANGESHWITTTDARRDVQHYRAISNAIVTGIGTVLADDPGLNVRDIETGGLQPLRVVLDRRLRIPAQARIFSVPGETLVFTVMPCPDREKVLEKAGIHVIRIDGSGEKDFLQAVFRHLAQQCDVNDVLVESGPVLAGSLLQAGLIDEFVIYMAPLLLGHTARPLLQLAGLEQMDDGIRLEYSDIRMIGDDVRIILKPVQTI